MSTTIVHCPSAIRPPWYRCQERAYREHRVPFANLILGIYLHVSRLVFRDDMVHRHMLLPRVDEVFRAAMAYAAATGAAVWQALRFRDVWHRSLSKFIVGLIMVNAPIHLVAFSGARAPRVLSTPERRRFAGAFLAAVLVILAASSTSKGAELTPATLNAWDAYVQAQDARVAEYSNGTPLLWSDQSPERLRHLHNGEMIIAPFGENPHRVPLGLIHHWIGAVFLPEARLGDVLSVLRDYGRYKDFYAPNVIQSRVLRQTDTEDTFSLRMFNKAVVTNFALDTEFQGTYTRLDANKSYGVAYTTRVREVEEYGMAHEREAPANTGRGLIWRLYSIARFEQRDGGVYLELEAVVLSRDIPGALRWLVDPIVRRTSKSSMRVSLEKTEGAVLERSRLARSNEKDNARAKLAFVNNPAVKVRNGLLP